MAPGGGAGKRSPARAAASLDVVHADTDTRSAAAVGAPLPPHVEFLGVLDGMQTVRGVLEVDASPELVYSILTDYGRCSEVRA